VATEYDRSLIKSCTESVNAMKNNAQPGERYESD
jgi:hypothetical protein